MSQTMREGHDERVRGWARVVGTPTGEGARLSTPITKLQCAIIEDAMLMLQRAKKRPDFLLWLRTAHEAWDWFQRDEPGYVFSFGSCCEGTGLDPQATRVQIAALRPAGR